MSKASDIAAPRRGGRLARQHGTTLVEVLIALVIAAFGLLGLAGLQMRLQLSDVESYQRAQALLLLDDMANRLAANRDQAAAYVTGAGAPLGSGVNCPNATGTLQQTDTQQWCTALQGTAESTGGNKTGAMIGARGCVETLGANSYLITVAWQGMTPTAAPGAGVACGAGLYAGAPGSTCTGDLCRRTVTTVLNIATLN
jgi:type IV pilus assembly protein PilV